MRHLYKVLNSIQTNLLIWGNPFDCNGQDVIICVTGNPGVTDFYIEFGSAIHNTTGLSVCVIGHAGHEEVPDKISNLLQGQESLFNLEGQINHKLDLIYNNIDKNSKLHLIGHSIGAWMILEALHKENDLINRIKSINLLFPTIQEMAKTKNGIFLNNFIRRFHTVVLFLYTLVHFLPECIKSFLIGIYLKMNSLPSNYKSRIYKYCNPKVGEKVLYLAYDEMDRVTALNNYMIDKLKYMTNIIYSDDDNWAPVSYMEGLSCYQPHLHMNKVNIAHAFVLRSSERVAEMVSSYIQPRINETRSAVDII